jgi:hypothetical protein
MAVTVDGVGWFGEAGEHLVCCLRSAATPAEKPDQMLALASLSMEAGVHSNKSRRGSQVRPLWEQRYMFDQC